MVVKLCYPYTQVPRNVCLSHRRSVTALTIAPYKYSYILAYLLIEEFLVNKYLWKFCGKLVRNKILLEGLECYKVTQMKAFDITKLAVELKSSDNVRYGNIILCWSFRGCSKYGKFTSNLPFEDCWS